jgi:hypothetical protein
MVTLEDVTTLRPRLKKITDDVDQLFQPSFFGSLEDLHEFEKRFRPLTVQVQDHECGKPVSDVKGCASRHFGPDDIRFCNAVVDSMSYFFQLLK